MSTASAPPAGPASVQEQEPRGALGLGPATALIVGSIIGVGIFHLPASLAVLAHGCVVICAGGGGTRISVQTDGMETR